MRSAVRRAGIVAASLLTLLVAESASARQLESTAQQQTEAQTPRRRADFLFGRPRGAVGVRGGWVFASAGSDIFDFVTRHLTLEREDFNTPAFAADVSFSVTDRADIQGSFELGRLSRPSEYREFVDDRLQPIEQTTELSTMHLTASVRYALVPRGRTVSRLAWVPARVVPYLGAGGGAIRYRFAQFGDFVDFQDFSVFADSFRSEGWAPTAHLFGGVDVQLYRSVYGTLQGRYTRAAGPLTSDFVDFEPIDLSGFRLSAGINILF